jgi:8-oxo-dGTP pyrophosphatase MutT (NUDIX family)
MQHNSRWCMPNRQRVVVTGGRDYADTAAVERTLQAVFARHRGATLVDSGATGAEALARAWAERTGVPVKTIRPDWDDDGRSAGYRRTERVLRHTQVVELVAFPGDGVVAHAVATAEQFGVDVTHG